MPPATDPMTEFGEERDCPDRVGSASGRLGGGDAEAGIAEVAEHDQTVELGLDPGSLVHAISGEGDEEVGRFRRAADIKVDGDRTGDCGEIDGVRRRRIDTPDRRRLERGDALLGAVGSRARCWPGEARSLESGIDKRRWGRIEFDRCTGVDRR